MVFYSCNSVFWLLIILFIFFNNYFSNTEKEKTISNSAEKTKTFEIFLLCEGIKNPHQTKNPQSLQSFFIVIPTAQKTKKKITKFFRENSRTNNIGG